MDRYTYEKALKNFNKMYIVFAMTIIILIAVIGGSLAAFLGNDVKVKANSEMIYYLTLSYDGVDINGLQSNDSTVSELKSGNLYVEDKLPEGLIFDRFLDTSDGTIGAVKRSDGSVCVGKVVDDTNDNGTWNSDNTEYTYHGLHYNANTGVVSYTVKDLKAGCDLSIGIVTKTPKKLETNENVSKNRRDFYNFALARDEDNTILSNNVHVFMGDEFGSLYTVSYEYTGDVPNVSLPDAEKHIAGVRIGVPVDIKVDGYTFNGWKSDDVNIQNGKYDMVPSNIVLKGDFTKKETHKVQYAIEGEIPSEYILPSVKDVYDGKNVKIDSLKIGTVINGYRFIGWSSDDVVINSNGMFVMPDKDVVIKGKFEEAKYNVSYAFYGNDLPTDYRKYLPDTKSYLPGDIVKLEDISDAVGYKFLGWYMDDKFIMPEDNIVIYGEWKRNSVAIDPTVNVEIVNESDYYMIGDSILYKIVVSNPSIFDINDVIVSSNNENTYFLDSDDYNILSDHMISIDYIKSGSSTVVYAQYDVSENDIGDITSEFEIVGATNVNGSILGDNDYKTSITFRVMPTIKLCNNVVGYDNKNIFQFVVTGDEYESWITLKNDECRTISLLPGIYKVKEVVPQEYKIDSIKGITELNNFEFEIKEDSTNDLTYNNKFKYKKFYHAFGRSIGKILGGE